MTPSHEPFPLDYELDQRLSPTLTLLHALQWLLIFLPILTVVSALAAEFLHLDPGAKAAFFQRTLFVCGLVTLVQTLAGHRLPLTEGPSAALLLCLATAASSGQAAVSGGMIAGGVLLAACGWFGFMRFLVPLFTDRVVGVILMLIALTILPFLLPMLTGVSPTRPEGDAFIFALSILLVALMMMMSHHLTGRLKTLSIFLGVTLGTLLFAVLGFLDTGPVRSMPWFALPRPAWGPLPKFDLSIVLAFALGYLAVLVNAMGSVMSVAPLVAADRVKARLDRGLGLTGLSGVLCGLAGVVGTVPYSNSPGVIAVTRVGTRYALTAAGGILILLALLLKVTALLTAVPSPVVGAALLTAMAAQIGVSLDIMQDPSRRMTGRDYTVIGLPILVGVLVGLLPEEFMAQVPAVLRPILKNGLIVGLVLVLLLEHVLLRQKFSSPRPAVPRRDEPV
jgi:uracil permease